MLYKAIVQTVLMYGRKSWVITESIMKVLEKVHHRVSQRIVGKTERHVGVEGWEWPPVEESLDAEVLWPMKDYV